MEKEFGSEVTKLVLGVTKLSKIHFSTENDYLIDYYKKIIVGISEDVRAIIIKLADRLHNMRTLWALPTDKQHKIAKESLEILNVPTDYNTPWLRPQGARPKSPIAALTACPPRSIIQI